MWNAAGKPEEHLAGYGMGIEKRLTGAHETQRFDQFSYGVSDRGASVRIPWQVAKDGHGYIEDRRPNANADPYVIAALMTMAIVEHLKKGLFDRFCANRIMKSFHLVRNAVRA